MARITQYLTFPLIWIFSKVFLNVRIVNGEALAKLGTGPLILVANHISFYDSFLLRLATTWTTLPIRFMGIKQFDIPFLKLLYKIGLVSLVYWIFGVFEVFPGRGIAKNLEIPTRILYGAGTVLIFPEGSINTSPTLMPFKHGAAALAIETGATILPVAFKENKMVMEGIDGGSKKQVTMTFGAPMTFPEGADYDASSEQLRQAVAALLV